MVAWLEQLASEELDQQEWETQEYKGYTNTFSERQGLALETRDDLERRISEDAQDLCSELDPDARSR